MDRRESLKLLGLLGLGATMRGLAVAHASPAPAGGTQAEAIAAAATEFTVDLYGRLKNQTGNLFFSPLSVETAMAMTSLGARGQTRAEMDRVLRLPFPRAHSGPGAYLNSLKSAPGGKYELAIANALWVRQGLALVPAYLQQTRLYFDATPYSVDFDQPESARQAINRWVERETRDRIKDLFGPGSLDSEIRLVLTNAIYFKGQWSDPFPKEQTRNEPFHVSSDKTTKAPLMRRFGEYRYFAGDGIQAVDLPYAGGRLAMLVVLPPPDGLVALEKELTAERLKGWVAKLSGKPGEVLLPRFTATSQFDLGAALQAMGIKQAFTRQADFGGMCAEPLYIGKVVHKAFVETNEEGSVAAAATGVVLPKPGPVEPEPEKPFSFRADHPFLFIIRDVTTGAPLFVGRIMNPVA